MNEKDYEKPMSSCEGDDENMFYFCFNINTFISLSSEFFIINWTQLTLDI